MAYECDASEFDSEYDPGCTLISLFKLQFALAIQIMVKINPQIQEHKRSNKVVGFQSNMVLQGSHDTTQFSSQKFGKMAKDIGTAIDLLGLL